MNDIAYSPGSSNKAIRVQPDPDILRDLIYGDGGEDLRDERSKRAYATSCQLREHQVHRLLRSIVQQFNARAKGRRERFKLIEEGDGPVLEYSC